MCSFICPICKNELLQNESTLKCKNNHSFDIAKQGYVNLFMSQQSSKKRHGDDKLMISARYDFLNKGYYSCLLDKAIIELKKYVKTNATILDAGCGECYYSENIYTAFKKQGLPTKIIGIDISRDALIAAKRRSKELKLAVSSIYDMPIKDTSIDIVLNFFAPLSESEYKRVLKDDGILFRIIPTKEHLFGLKSQVYDNPYYNNDPTVELDGFTLIDTVTINENLVLTNNNDILNLFKMTPYYYKTGVYDQNKINSLKRLKTEIGFIILIYKKQS